MKAYLLAIAGLIAIVLVVGGVKVAQIFTLVEAGENMQMPPTVVTATQIEEQVWEQQLTSVGTLEAVQGVEVSADLPGRVTEIKFTAGAKVNQGDELVRQDISSELAQLRAAEASAELANANLERVRSLYSKNVASKSELDVASARYKEAIALADNIRVSIDKKTIKAPFDGRLGVRLIDLGSDLTPGKPIVSLQAVNPILVNFSIPQRDLQKISTGLSVDVSTDAVTTENFPGEITVISPEVSATTRNVLVQASIDNSSGQLLPGMFVSVNVKLPQADTVIAAPLTAISHATFGDSIFIVADASEGDNKNKIAQQKFVQLGRRKGDFIAIKEGAQAGDTIISTGVFKIFNGMSVTVNNEAQPEFKIDPQPDNS